MALSSLIDVEDFQKFSGVYADADDNTQSNCLEMAQNVVENYLGYKIDSWYSTLPMILKQTVFRIGTLLQQESSGNIGINSKSFGESGSRTFLNIVDYSKYLMPLSEYRLYFELNRTAKDGSAQ